MEILRKIVFVFICVFPFVGFSQITFYKKFTSGPFDQGNGLTQLPDSSYAVTGTSGGFDNNSGQAFLMLTDSLGNQKWTKNYGGFGEDIGVRVIHVPGDGFFVAGYSGSTVNGNFDFVLYKTDEQGNLQWEKMYGGTDWEKLNDAALLADGGLILVGETKGFLSQKKDIFMVRTSPLGDTVWTKTISTPADDFVSAVKVISPTEFIIGGNIGESGYSKGMLMSFNIDGTENWSTVLNQAGISTVRAIAIYQNNIFITGSLHNSTLEKEDVWLMRTDLNGAFVSHWFYQGFSLGSYYNAIAVRDLNNIHLGLMTDAPELNPFPGGLDAVTHRFNSGYVLISSHGFSGYNDDIINQMIVANDGGIVLVGTVSDNPEASSLGTDVMLARIGPNDEGTSNPDVGLDLVSLVSEEKKTMSIYPNPTDSYINMPSELENQLFEMRNIQGQVVKSGVVTSKLFMDALGKGVYFLSISDQHQIWSAKIIKK